MSAVLSQSATNLSVSNDNPEWDDEMFASRVKVHASRNAKGVTRESQLLNRQKLIAMLCADYRAHFVAIYGKTDRLPTAIFERVEKAVDNFISEKMKEVNVTNSISYRRSFFHNHKEMEVTERVQVTGENKLTLQEQHLGVTIFITQAEKRLKDLEAKKTPDYEREKEVKANIMRLNLTKQFIEGEMKHQEELKNKTS